MRGRRDIYKEPAMRAIVVLAACTAGFLMLGAGGQPGKKETTKGATPAAGALSISSVAFMSGQWRGQTEDGVFEEHWSRAEGNNIMGMFRWLKADGTPVMFEMLAMTQEPEGVFMRLKHFNSKLVGREEKGEATTLRLASASPTRAEFAGAEGETHVAGAVYERTADALHITIRFTDDKREPLKFELKRMGAEGK